MSIIEWNRVEPETSYWMDDFLQVRQRQDEYFETQETLLYKEYITKQLPQEFEITKADQADFLNKSLSFSKKRRI